VSAIAAYGRLFQRVTALRLTHPELYTCHSNRAAALLRLGLFDEALLDAERCRLLAAESFKKCALCSTAGLRADCGYVQSVRPLRCEGCGYDLLSVQPQPHGPDVAVVVACPGFDFRKLSICGPCASQSGHSIKGMRKTQGL